MLPAQPERPTTPNLDLVPLTVEQLRVVEQSLYINGGRFTTQQRLFFEYLLSSPTLDESHAARQAGVSPVKARRWLQSPAVRQAIDHLMKERLKRQGIDKDWVLQRIIRSLDKADARIPIRKVAWDPALSTFVSQEVLEDDLQAAKGLAEQLAKHVRLWGDEDAERLSVNVQLNLGDLPS